MNETKNQKIIVGVVVIAMVLLGLYLKFSNNDQLATLNDSKGEEATTSATVTQNTNNTPTYQIEQVPIVNQNKLTPPDTSKPIIFGSNTNYPEDIRKLYIDKINELRSKIKSDPTNLGLWIDLGSYEKVIGDYKTALEYWTFVSKSAPTDFISLGNIGNLYAYYLKDNGQAEVYYRKALVNGPKQSYLYIQLAEVYKDVFRDLEKAKSIVSEGLKAIPNDPSLTQFQEVFLK